ncbi:MAG: YybH family protein [Gemmatimonadaceae bacterium]
MRDLRRTTSGSVAAALFVLAASAFIACAGAETGEYSDSPSAGTESARADSVAVRDAIVSMFQAGAAAWNRGDLDAFMSDYAVGARTTYIGSSGLLRGPEQIRSAYAPRFAPGGNRDSLSFENIEVDVLAPGVVHAVAYYVLARGDSVTSRGPTSLILLKTDGTWRIVHDHSS